MYAVYVDTTILNFLAIHGLLLMIYIVDITVGQQQFKKVFPQDAVQRCYVGTNSEFHSMFEIEPFQCRRFCGLRKLDEYAYQRMKELYDVILDCIK